MTANTRRALQEAGMSLIVRAFPLHGSVEDLDAFAAALNTDRKEGADLFYRQYGVSHESWHLQETPQGPWVIAVTAVDDSAAAAATFAASRAEFDNWFKAQVLLLTGINQDKQPLGPPTKQVFAWPDERRPDTLRP